MSIDFSQLREFILAIAQTDITELNLKSENFELMVRKHGIAPVQDGTVASAVNASSPPATVPSSALEVPTPSAKEKDKRWLEVTSPMVGTFYRAPAPGEAPFVEVNDHIRVGQTVCIIEAMKLMNEIETEIAGQVVEIVVENGESVEYGQTLMWVAPG